jgi:hypothetical protein
MPRNTRPLRYVQQYEINPNFTRRKYLYERFSAPPLWLNDGATGVTAVPTAAAAQTDIAVSHGGNVYELYQTTAQTILPFAHDSKGWEISGDEVDNETLEIVPGGNKSSSPLAFTLSNSTTAGDDFFIRAVFEFTDASGSDQFGIGFRKQEAFAVPTSFLTTGDGIYTDFVLFGFAATVADPNPVNIAYDQNNSGSTTVQAANFTWADTLVHELQIRVIGRKPQFLINGVRLGNPVAKDALGNTIASQSTVTGPVITLDEGDVMVPFIFLRHDAAVAEDTYLRELEIGRMVDIGLDKNAE